MIYDEDNFPRPFVAAPPGWRVARLSMDDSCDYNGKYVMEALPGWMFYQDDWRTAVRDDHYLLADQGTLQDVLTIIGPGELTLKKRWELRGLARLRARYLNAELAKRRETRQHVFPPDSAGAKAQS